MPDTEITNTPDHMSHLPELTSFEGSLAQRVYSSLKTAILHLDYKPGEFLRKAAICETLGVSRSPVTEAISRLADEGLVDVIPQSGSRVSKFSMEEIKEAVFIRSALEGAIAEKVATSHSPSQLAELQRLLRYQKFLIAEGDYAEFYEADEQMHALLARYSGFPRLSKMVANTSSQIKRARILLISSSPPMAPKAPQRAAETYLEHEKLILAIEAQDGALARSEMTHHLSMLIDRLKPLEEEYPDLFHNDTRSNNG